MFIVKIYLWNKEHPHDALFTEDMLNMEILHSFVKITFMSAQKPFLVQVFNKKSYLSSFTFFELSLYLTHTHTRAESLSPTEYLLSLN